MTMSVKSNKHFNKRYFFKNSKIDWPLNLKNSCLTVTLSQNMNVKSLFKILNSFMVQ